MADVPTVSIIVPTFARRAQLKRCLDGIVGLAVAEASFEVIVVDDGGPEPLDVLVASYAERLDVRLIRQSRAGPAAARNVGAAVARGRFLAFIDDDCRPEPGWLPAMIRELKQDDRRLLGGLVENALTKNPYATASEHISRFVYEYGQMAGAREPFFTTNNMALAADLFRAIGGFTTAIPSATAEDKEFCDRWTAHGLALTHVPTMVVHHAHDLTLAGFLRQHFNYGRGILTFRLMRRRRTGGPLLPQPLKFYRELVSSSLRRPSCIRRERLASLDHGQPSSIGRWRLAALLAVAQLATLAGALREAVFMWRRPSRASDADRRPGAT